MGAAAFSRTLISSSDRDVGVLHGGLQNFRIESIARAHPQARRHDELTEHRGATIRSLRRCFLMPLDEDRCESVAVGGLAADVGFYQPAFDQPIESVVRDALGKLIALTRRKLGLTGARFAERADIDLAVLVRLEHAEPFALDPPTVTRLAGALSVSASRLMGLAGLAGSVDLSPPT